MATLTPEELVRLKAEYEELASRVDSLNDAERLRLQIYRDQIAAAERLSRTTEEQREIQAELVENLRAAVKEETDYTAKTIRRKVLNEELLKQQRMQLGALRQQALNLEEMTPEMVEQLNILEKQVEAMDAMAEASRENDRLINDISGTMEDKLIKSTLRFADMMGRPMSDKLSALNNKMNRLTEAGFGKLIAEVKKLVFEFDHLTKSFERQFQLGPQYTQSIEEQYHSLVGFGVSIEDAIEAQSQLATSFTDFTMLSKNQRDAISENSLVLNELGVAQADFAKGMQNTTKFFGQSAEQAIVTQREITATARELGREPGAIAAEFAAAGGSLAKFGEDGVKAFKDLSRISKITGMEMDKVLSITNRFDTFEGAAEMAGQLNAALGGNFVNAMDMMMETDPAARFESIRDAITGAGLTFDDMSYYQKQFYTESLGLSDVGDLAMMLSGNMDDLAGATNKSAEELIAEKERAKEVQSAQEELTIAMNEVVKSFTKFAPVLQMVVGLIGKLAAMAHVIIPAMVAYKTVMMGLAIAKGINMAATKGLIAAETAQALTGKKAAIGLALVAASVALLVGALMIASPSKVVLAMFGLAAALFAIGKVAERVGVGLAVAGKSMIGIGAGAFLAGVGVAAMAAAFSLLSVEQMLGMGTALLAFGAALYFGAPALTTFALAMVGVGLALANPVAAMGLALFGATIATIAVSVFIVAAGIGLMGTGLAKMFEAISIPKSAAFGIMIGALALAAPALLVAGFGLAGVGTGMLLLAAALAIISSKDLESIAQFATGMAEINIQNINGLTTALRGVADAMDDIPTAKAIALTATMTAAETAAQAARVLGNQPQAAPVARTTTQANRTNNQPVNINLRLEIDGEALDAKIVETTTSQQSSGGALDVIANILN